MQYKFKEFAIRALMTVMEAIVLYMAYTFISDWLLLPHIPVLYAVLAAVLGLFANTIQIKSMKETTRRAVIIGLGLVLSGTTVAYTIGYSNIAGIMLVVIMFLLIWVIAIKNYNSDYEYLYTIDQFYNYTAVLLVLNVLASISKSMAYIRMEFTSYTILYVAVGILVLFEMRNARYSRNVVKQTSVFDIVTTVLVMLSIFVASMPSAMSILLRTTGKILGVAYAAITKLLIIISMPIGYLMDFIGKFLNPLIQKFISSWSDIKLDEIKEEEIDAWGNYSSDNFKKFVEVLAVIILIAIILTIIYYAYRYFEKQSRKKAGEAYEEEKEFIGGIGVVGIKKLMGKVSGQIAKAYKKAIFNITANNMEKLRNEYKLFLNKLYAKNILTPENYTPNDVYESLLQKYPQTEDSIKLITRMYEDVRYGAREPKEDDLKGFRININRVFKAISN